MFIGLSQRLVNSQYNELRTALALEWGEFFKRHLQGFLPLPLLPEFTLCDYESTLCGLILSGGNDLSIFNKSKENILRDEYEARLIKECMRLNLPLLCVCRGSQFLAHFFGSKLEACEKIAHLQKEKICHTKPHFVSNKEGEEFEVNSFHNYAILELGEDLEALFFAKDGSIEAFRHKNLPFFALMWHIERVGGMEQSAVFKEWLQEVKIRLKPLDKGGL